MRKTINVKGYFNINGCLFVIENGNQEKKSIVTISENDPENDYEQVCVGLNELTLYEDKDSKKEHTFKYKYWKFFINKKTREAWLHVFNSYQSSE